MYGRCGTADQWSKDELFKTDAGTIKYPFGVGENEAGSHTIYKIYSR